MGMPWVVRSVIAGAAGTAVMTLAYEVERRVRHRTTSLDYDDSDVPGVIVANILDLKGLTTEEDLELGELLVVVLAGDADVGHLAGDHDIRRRFGCAGPEYRDLAGVRQNGHAGANTAILRYVAAPIQRRDAAQRVRGHHPSLHYRSHPPR